MPLPPMTPEQQRQAHINNTRAQHQRTNAAISQQRAARRKSSIEAAATADTNATKGTMHGLVGNTKAQYGASVLSGMGLGALLGGKGGAVTGTVIGGAVMYALKNVFPDQFDKAIAWVQQLIRTGEINSVLDTDTSLSDAEKNVTTATLDRDRAREASASNQDPTKQEGYTKNLLEAEGKLKTATKNLDASYKEQDEARREGQKKSMQEAITGDLPSPYAPAEEEVAPNPPIYGPAEGTATSLRDHVYGTPGAGVRELPYSQLAVNANASNAGKTQPAATPTVPDVPTSAGDTPISTATDGIRTTTNKVAPRTVGEFVRNPPVEPVTS